MRVLYLFTGIRGGLVEKVKRGEDPGDGTWGMLRLKHFGVEAEHLELEQVVPVSVARFLRRYVFGNYGAHLPFIWRFFRYDIVFTAGAFYSQLVVTLLRGIFGFKKPLWIMHDFSINSLLGEGKNLRQKVFRFLVSKADGVVTIGKEEAEKLKQRFPHLSNKVAYIPFGVDTNFFRPNSQATEENRILSVGIDPDRDWHTLFKACEGLGVKVVVATRPRGSKEIKTPSFVEKRLFSLQELVEEYSKASMVVIPLDTSTGVNDAMGCTALFEAMSAGKAIIATDTHIMRSHITHGKNGLLVPEGDVEALQLSIQKLFENMEERESLGKAARIYAEEYLNSEKLAGQLADYFKRLLV